MDQPNNFRAVFDALFGKDISYYPRKDGQVIEAPALIAGINAELKDVALPAIDAKNYVDRVKDSLEEVKKHTEYQDQKVSRLLTIVAFLTAAAGTIFGKMVDTYPLYAHIGVYDAKSILIVLCYLLFGAYLIFVASGALVAFHATQTRFIGPQDEDEATDDKVKSFLFFQNILTTNPAIWAKAFLKENDPTAPSDALLTRYFKNYIAETYLIAAKIGDKLRYLRPAQSILLWAIRIMVFWLIVLVLTFSFVQPPARASAAPEKKDETTPTAAGTAPSPVLLPAAGSGSQAASGAK